MICITPLTLQKPSGHFYKRRCGSCLSCVMQKAAQWTLRCTLENTVHPQSSFITLTYGPESLPDGGTLSKSDLQAFFARLRVNITRLSTQERLNLSVSAPSPRYYSTGEYGSQSARPHYHALLFGLGTASRTLLEQAWTHGNVYIKPFVIERAAYVARYTTKKSFWPLKPSDGRASEFSLMSQKPGLGHGALQRVAATLLRHKKRQTAAFTGTIPLQNNLESLWAHGIPESLRLNGKIYPLGPYLVNELCRLVGIKGPGSPEWSLASKQLQKPLLDAAWDQRQAMAKAKAIQHIQQMKRQ